MNADPQTLGQTFRRMNEQTDCHIMTVTQEGAPCWLRLAESTQVKFRMFGRGNRTRDLLQSFDEIQVDLSWRQTTRDPINFRRGHLTGLGQELAKAVLLTTNKEEL